jgi:putative transposon-encoded protein
MVDIPLFGRGTSGMVDIPLFGLGTSGMVDIPLFGLGTSGMVEIPLFWPAANDIAKFVAAIAMTVITNERRRLAVCDMAELLMRVGVVF